MTTWWHNDIGAHPDFGGDFDAALRAITARAIILPAELDRYFPPIDAEYEARGMPNAECRPIPGVWGHMAPVEPASQRVHRRGAARAAGRVAVESRTTSGGRQHGVLRRRVAVEGGDQRARRPLAHLRHLDAHGRQRRAQEGGELEVVEAGQREVARHLAARRPRRRAGRRRRARRWRRRPRSAARRPAARGRRRARRPRSTPASATRAARRPPPARPRGSRPAAARRRATAPRR